MTTVILLRHAEKEATGEDPALSAAGKERAERLPGVFKNFRPNAFYATPYARTRQTLSPWADRVGKPVRPYDPRDQAAFAEELKRQYGQVVVVAGHSNTIPALVNLLIGRNQYSPLAEDVYNRVWIVTVRQGVATHEQKEY